MLYRCTMSTTRPTYLKGLLQLNREIPVTTEKLKHMGISPFLARKYKESGWLKSIGVGAYKFPGTQLTIEGLLHAIQKDLSLNVYTGAKTALEMAGIRQYYREKEKVYLFSDRKSNLPLWIKNYPWARDILTIKTSKWNKKEYLYNPGTREFDFFVASKELAILQQIELINRGESFAETAQLFEILDSLNPDLLNEILTEASVKAKRIFLYLADFYNHPWKKNIHPEVIDSGSSVITVEKRGKYLKKYHLVIPGGFNV